MKEFVPVLKRTKLFSGVGEDDITALLSCLGARLHTFKKGEYVLRQGERRENFTFREMIIGATAAFLDISRSEKYSARHMWHRKAGHS